MAQQQAQKLASYAWEGVDRNGKKIKGELSAVAPSLVKAQLRKQGINATRINKKMEFGFGKKKIKQKDVALFTRQMATMLRAGVPLVQAFDIIGEGMPNPRMRDVMSELKAEVASGNSFASALRKKPLLFDELYCNLVDAGEQSGTLESLLERVADYKEKSEALKSKVKKALVYPAAVVVVALVVSAVLLIKVVPQFKEVFEGFGAELPAFTLMVIGLSEFMTSKGYWVVIGLVALGFALNMLYKRSKQFRDNIDRGMLKLPLVGQIIYKSAVARYARTLSTTFNAGVPLVEALDSVAGATGNIVFKNAVLRVKQDVSQGTQLNFAMRTVDVFPSLVVQMAAIGEESGALDEMLGKAADFYETEVDDLVDNMTTLMEPMIMSVLGVLVGGLVIAMYLPIFQMGSVA